MTSKRKPTTLVEWLKLTREQLVTRGWVRGLPRNGARCVLMTLEHVCDSDLFWYRNLEAVLRELKQTAGIYPEDSIVAWNDRQPNVEAVLDVIDRTITRLEHGEAANQANG